MADTTADTQRALERLLKSSENQLYEELGTRTRALQREFAVAGQVEPKVTYDVALMGPLDGVRALGKRIFHRWNVEANKLMCGDDPEHKADREKLLTAANLTDAVVGTTISTALISVGLAPAIAVVV